MLTTPRVDLWDCQNGAKNEAWSFAASADAATVGGFAAGALKNSASGKCLTVVLAGAGPSDNTMCENIWSRPLANGDVALAMVNQVRLRSLSTSTHSSGLLSQMFLAFVALVFRSPGGERDDLVRRGVLQRCGARQGEQDQGPRYDRVSTQAIWSTSLGLYPSNLVNVLTTSSLNRPPKSRACGF